MAGMINGKCGWFLMKIETAHGFWIIQFQIQLPSISSYVWTQLCSGWYLMGGTLLWFFEWDDTHLQGLITESSSWTEFPLWNQSYSQKFLLICLTPDKLHLHLITALDTCLPKITRFQLRILDDPPARCAPLKDRAELKSGETEDHPTKWQVSLFASRYLTLRWIADQNDFSILTRLTVPGVFQWLTVVGRSTWVGIYHFNLLPQNRARSSKWDVRAYWYYKIKIEIA